MVVTAAVWATCTKQQAVYKEATREGGLFVCGAVPCSQWMDCLVDLARMESLQIGKEKTQGLNLNFLYVDAG